MPAQPDNAPGPLLDHALVECPRCQRQAVVQLRHTARLTCSHCGYSRDRQQLAPVTWASVRQDGRDPVAGLPLWLTAECCGGELLWALNHAHLDYLARFVASTQRDRDFPSPPGNRGLAYKLPRWMQLARNREDVLKTIDRLKSRSA